MSQSQFQARPQAVDRVIGGIALAHPLCLAPLAGVTSLPMREFFTELGASLTHTEMVSCAGLVRGNERTVSMLQTSSREAPLILQLFAPDAAALTKGAEAALKINITGQSKPFAGLGINMACPMPKVTKRGAGAALLRNPEEAFLMVRSLKENLRMPVWVKIRRLESLDGTLRFIEGLLHAGADNVCLHGRTAAQRYEGMADKNFVAGAARRFPGFVSASGDVRTAKDIQEYLEAGCVSVMLARGAVANPWLLPEALHELGYEVPAELLNPSQRTRLDALCRLGVRAEETLGERQAVFLLKRLTGGALREIEGASELRRRAGCASSLSALLDVFKEGMRD